MNESTGYGEKFQGKEITCTVQAPTPEILDYMLIQLSDYTDAMGMEPVKVLEKGPDPDGGMRAVITAHNFNPVKWLSEQTHKAKLGLTKGWSEGQQLAEAKHDAKFRQELAKAKLPPLARKPVRAYPAVDVPIEDVEDIELRPRKYFKPKATELIGDIVIE